jgi:hypothetical protein
MQTTEQRAEERAADVTPPPRATITTVGPDGKQVTLTVPNSIEEMQALDARRDALSEQLTSAAGRRDQIASELATTSATGPARTGLEERLKVLDQRIVQLETDLALTGQQVAAAPGDLARTAAYASRNTGGGDDFGEGVAAGGFFISLAWVAILTFRWWRRKRRGPAKTSVKTSDESDQRLERLEQGMDAIAIEIERVSEGQRFVTKLLSEANPLSGRQIAPAEQRVEANR